MNDNWQWQEAFFLLTFPISIPMLFLIQDTPFGKLGDKLPYRPRFLNFLWAVWGGYFWCRCTICHKYYGGHEHGNGSLMYSWNHGTTVCRKCAPLAEQINLQNMPKMMPESMESVFLPCKDGKKNEEG